MSRSAAEGLAAAPPEDLDGRWRRRVLDAAESLASPGPVVGRALALLEGPWTPSSIARCVGESPELTAQMIRAASSARLGGRVRSLEEAVLLLGANALRGWLVAAATYRLMEAPIPAYGLRRYALVSHGRETARTAQSLARLVCPREAPQAYLVGLLHDLGKPILAAAGGLELKQAIDGPAGGDTCDAERSVFGADHARIGAWICSRWGLADDLVAAIAAHHAAPASPLARVLHLANMIAHIDDDPALIGAIQEAGGDLGLDPAALESVAAGEMGVPPPPGLTPREVAVLRGLSAGLSVKEVALKLELSPNTVNYYLHRVYRVLGVSGQTQAVLVAEREGWL
ncbi:MAG: HDOD domain-containing protein [Actinomycetota bacterium]